MTENEDCHDDDACTLDICDEMTARCVYVPIPECCRSSAECDDFDVCTSQVVFERSFFLFGSYYSVAGVGMLKVKLLRFFCASSCHPVSSR